MAVIDRLMRKLKRRDDVTEAERAALEGLVARLESHPPRACVVREGEPQDSSRLLIEGLACRQKILSDGRRQILELHLSGDFVDLHSFTLKKLDHDVVSMTAVTFAVVPHEALREITETMPHLTRLLWLNTTLDAAIHREWVVSTGRRSALAQVANLFCELFVRSDIVGLADGHAYALPITQEDMADICGLTSIHVNRMLQELRGTGAVEWRQGRVVIHDWPALQAIAGFDPAYLNLHRTPR